MLLSLLPVSFDFLALFFSFQEHKSTCKALFQSQAKFYKEKIKITFLEDVQVGMEPYLC